jgi:hypothetical protein
MGNTNTVISAIPGHTRDREGNVTGKEPFQQHLHFDPKAAAAEKKARFFKGLSDFLITAACGLTIALFGTPQLQKNQYGRWEPTGLAGKTAELARKVFHKKASTPPTTARRSKDKSDSTIPPPNSLPMYDGS